MVTSTLSLDWLSKTFSEMFGPSIKFKLCLTSVLTLTPFLVAPVKPSVPPLPPLLVVPVKITPLRIPPVMITVYVPL